MSLKSSWGNWSGKAKSACSFVRVVTSGPAACTLPSVHHFILAPVLVTTVTKTKGILSFSKGESFLSCQNCLALFSPCNLNWCGLAWHSKNLSLWSHLFEVIEGPWTDPCCSQAAGCPSDTSFPPHILFCPFIFFLKCLFLPFWPLCPSFYASTALALHAHLQLILLIVCHVSWLKKPSAVLIQLAAGGFPS